MTMTPSSHAAQFDTGPLSWVMGEIRDALGRSGASLVQATESGAEARDGALKHAKTHLHQAHGALQMVDVDGAGLMTQAAEEAIDRFKDGALECDAGRVQVVASAYQAVIEYMEELLSGAPQQPARLFPYYRALQEMLGAERIHPADLFFADLGSPGELPPAPPSEGAPDYAACRARFEKALLGFMKSADAPAQRASAQALQEAIGQVAAAQAAPPERAFWLAMQGFAELVADGQLETSLFVKQLFGMINLQIRRLSQGQGSLPDALLRDALFFVAAAPNPSADAQALRRAYRLDGLVPADYDQKRYGRIDAAALATAKQALAQAQQAWDRLSSEINPALESEFQQQLDILAGACARLGSRALAQLQLEFRRAAKDSIASGRSAQFSLEMATAMLFVEHGLNRIRQLPDDFDAHAELIGARLLALAAGETPPDAPQWQGELSRQIQQVQTVSVLAAEMKNSLRQVEKVLDDYYADGSKRPALAQIDPLLHQLQGAVAILDLDDAMRATLHVKDAVRVLAGVAGDAAAESASLQNIAQNVGALGFFVDMLAQNVDAARKRFAFDPHEGMLRALPFDKAAGADLANAGPVDAALEAAAPADAEVPAETTATVSLAPTPAASAAPDALPLPASTPLPADDGVEAELLEIFIGEAQEVLEVVHATLPAARAEPSSQPTLTVLRRSFHTLKGSGRMVGLTNFAEGAAAVEKLMNLWLAETRAATPDLLALLERAGADMQAWVAELAASGSSGRDSAALVDAATRMQQGGAFTMDETPQEQAEVAAAAEPVAPIGAFDGGAFEPAGEAFDAAPSEESIDAFDVALPEETIEAFDAGLPEETIDAFDAELPPEETIEAFDAELPEDAIEAFDAELPEEAIEAFDASDVRAADAPAPSEAPHGAKVIDFPSIVRPIPPDDNTKRIGTLEIPLPLYNIYMAETDELVRALTRDFGEWRHEPHRAVSAEALKAAHTLAGTSATVGFKALREVAYALEMALKTPVPKLDEAQRDLLDETVERARQMLAGFALGELAPGQPDLVARLEVLRTELEAADAITYGAHADPALEEKLHALFEATLESIIASPPAVRELAAPSASASASPVADDIDALFGDPFDAPSLTQAAPPPAVEVDDGGDDAGDDLDLEPELIDEPEPPADAHAQAHAEEVNEEAHAEGNAEAHAEADAEVHAEVKTGTHAEPFAEADTGMYAEVDAHSHADVNAGAEVAVPADMGAGDAVPVDLTIADDLDPDLLPVFLEEATDLLPEIGNGLRTWQANPADTAPAQMLQRALHTVKGSARMAGAMRLGQHAHDIETQIENMVHAGTTTPAAFDELLANYDHALMLFEQLHNPAGAAASAAAAPLPTLVPAKAADEGQGAQARTPLVRVRADMLDRLVNQAGEVSITRSKLESQVASLKTSLADFSENLVRLRRQLREVEMQAESQIASRMSISSEREFDSARIRPLHAPAGTDAHDGRERQRRRLLPREPGPHGRWRFRRPGDAVAPDARPAARPDAGTDGPFRQPVGAPVPGRAPDRQGSRQTRQPGHSRRHGRDRPQRAGTDGRAVRTPAAQRHRARHRNAQLARRQRQGRNRRAADPGQPAG